MKRETTRNDRMQKDSSRVYDARGVCDADPDGPTMGPTRRDSESVHTTQNAGGLAGYLLYTYDSPCDMLE
jgi:hypothetical protein